MSATNSPFDALCIVTAALEHLGVRHMICGSLASSVHGEPRTTHDFDLVADLSLDDAAEFVASLGDAFFADEAFVREAIGNGSSFNVLHLATAHKIDVFPLRPRPFSREELRRARARQVAEGVRLPVASAEDTLLTKLEWFRKTGEQADRQWRDALGVVKQQRRTLDLDYCHKWANELGIGDLLDRVLGESG